MKVPATRYPANHASGINANFSRDLMRHDPAQITAFATQYANWDPVLNRN